MPSAPEYRDIFRKIGQIKIGKKIISHTFCAADRNIRIPGKIKIDLDGIGYDCQKNGCPVKRTGNTKHIIHKHRQVIRKDHLFQHTKYDQLNTLFQSSQCDPPVFLQLREKIRCTDDRTCHKLRKETQIQRQTNKIMLH